MAPRRRHSSLTRKKVESEMCERTKLDKPICYADLAAHKVAVNMHRNCINPLMKVTSKRHSEYCAFAQCQFGVTCIS